MVVMSCRPKVANRFGLTDTHALVGGWLVETTDVSEKKRARDDQVTGTKGEP